MKLNSYGNQRVPLVKGMGCWVLRSECITLRPIAYVSNGWSKPPRYGWQEVVSEIWFRPGLREHLVGLNEFSHCYILFWMHHNTKALQERARVHPRGQEELPLVGVFATHSPCRPNPIGLTVVELVHCSEDSLWVRGLDALDGSPVLDIKSYVPRQQEQALALYPAWVRQLGQR